MSDKISRENLENVTGGVIRIVENDAVSYANIRIAPGLNSKVLAKVNNGTKVNTTGRTVKLDGYVWYEVTLAGGSDCGWIAGSLIGY